MEPLSSCSHRENKFHLIMNVCGENPIMAALHQAYRKHRSTEAKAFKGHISQLDEGCCANHTPQQAPTSHMLMSVLVKFQKKQVVNLTKLHLQNNWTESGVVVGENGEGVKKEGRVSTHL